MNVEQFKIKHSLENFIWCSGRSGSTTLYNSLPNCYHTHTFLYFLNQNGVDWNDIEYNYDFNHKEGWINIQDFYYGDELLCINMCESYPFTHDDYDETGVSDASTEFNPHHKDNTRWADRYDEVVKLWVE